MARPLARVPGPTRCARPDSVGDGVHRRLIRVGEKGGSEVGKTKRGKGSKWMVVVDGAGLPLGIHVTAASPGEVTLLPATLKTIRVPGLPRHRPLAKLTTLVGDMAYDSDPAREQLAAQGIRLIVPYRSNCVHRRYEDHRRLKRYRRRWVVERTFAWLGGFRRLLVRHERFTSMYRSFLYFAAALIALRRF